MTFTEFKAILCERLEDRPMKTADLMRFSQDGCHFTLNDAQEVECRGLIRLANLCHLQQPEIFKK